MPFGGRKENNKHKKLKTPPTKLPEFKVDRDILTRKGFRCEVSYAGVVPNVPLDVDVTNRTEVLRIIDHGKNEGKIPINPVQCLDVTLWITNRDIKLLKQNDQEMLRILMEEIAYICYIFDDGLEILSIKFGTPERCDLAVLYCDDKTIAEGICTIIETCFQILHEDVVIQILDQLIPDYNNQNSTPTHSSSHPDYLPNDDLDSIDSTNTCILQKLVKEYMKELSSTFSLTELGQFANLFKEVNNSSEHSPFEDTCKKLLALYGPERKYLLKGLCPFISSKNYDYFMEFLQKNGIDVKEADRGTLSSTNSNYYLYTRSISDVSEQNFDIIMGEISNKFQTLDASMGSVNSSYLQA